MALMQLSLPVVVLLAFIVFKLNHEQKRWLFKVPIWISSTVLSLGIGHLASGVMGFYGAAFCDLLLYPAMLLVKKAWDRKDKKLHNQNQSQGRLSFELPRSVAVN
jgi:hypothetical protein